MLATTFLRRAARTTTKARRLARTGRSYAVSAPGATSGSTSPHYDVCVIGGGHAGCEAAAGSARTGARTLLLTNKLDTIGELSCNPSFGGVGKGTLVREVDALGGVCASVVDQAGCQFHMLNRSKGPAVWGPRAQIDRTLYKQHMQKTLFAYPNLDIRPASVFDLVFDHSAELNEPSSSTSLQRWGKVTGVKLDTGEIIPCSSVVICTGTFLSGEIHVGKSGRDKRFRILITLLNFHPLEVDRLAVQTWRSACFESPDLEFGLFERVAETFGWGSWVVYSSGGISLQP